MRIGIPTGRLFQHLPTELQEKWAGGRRLHWITNDEEIFALRPKAIPALVAQGLLDEGYCGSDSLREFLMPELLDVEIVKRQEGVRMVVAAARKDILITPFDRPLVVGTSYPVTASRYLGELGKAHIIVEQPGCIEGLCPVLVDLVIDISETGKTLQANGLCVVEDLGGLSVIRVTRNY